MDKSMLIVAIRMGKFIGMKRTNTLPLRSNVTLRKSQNVCVCVCVCVCVSLSLSLSLSLSPLSLCLKWLSKYYLSAALQNGANKLPCLGVTFELLFSI